jgi:DNA-directed RNA polymerase subunit RPC12/RpoP
MAQLLVCKQCGTGFEHDPTAYGVACPDCNQRYYPSAGCC